MVIDAWQQNENMVKDVTPLPDQDMICEDVARAKFRSKIDLSDAYEQVCIELEDVDKTAFMTISGTYVSMVRQQGDCNAPATFQQLMTVIFQDIIGKFMHIYLHHIRVILNRLRQNHLYLK
jgi:hypothetical protein